MTGVAAPRNVTLGLTGASGMAYGLRLLECLLAARVRVALVYSQAAQIVAKQELDLVLPARPQEAAAFLLERYRAPAELVICPCSMGTLAAVACGLAENLIERAADVALKERRTLVLVARETPLSAIHLENMIRLARAGAVVLPANPGFYHRPQRVEDLVDFVVARILDHLGLENEISARWGRAPKR